MRAEVLVRGVGPEDAWRWWTDYREGSQDHAFAAWAHPERRVETLEDGRVRITESARVLGLRFLEVATLELAKPRVRFETRNNFGAFRGAFRFQPSESGTRIEVVWEQRLAWPLRWLGPVGRGLVRAFYRWDLRHHARDLEREAA